MCFTRIMPRNCRSRLVEEIPSSSVCWDSSPSNVSLPSHLVVCRPHWSRTWAMSTLFLLGTRSLVVRVMMGCGLFLVGTTILTRPSSSRVVMVPIWDSGLMNWHSSSSRGLIKGSCWMEELLRKECECLMSVESCRGMLGDCWWSDDAPMGCRCCRGELCPE